MKYSPKSLVALLRRQAETRPEALAYRFLSEEERGWSTLTYRQVDRRARAIGSILQSFAKQGDRALLLLPPGLDFIAAFWGCLYARVLAIPTYPPHPARLERNMPIVARIAADAQPVAALVTAGLKQVIQTRNGQPSALDGLVLLEVDQISWGDWAGQWEQQASDPEDLAFLQYTSGSTTTPRGVMLTHGNLLYNMELIARCFGVTDQSHGVIWLPPYHDMGLIGGILQPVFSGISVTLMSHMMFLQQPLRWLQAISQFGATISGGPNFAYDLCVQKVKPEQRAQLNLSKWDVAFNGAEPVHHRTLERFSNYFAPCGFRQEAFLPCYGLAESTLMVTGGPKGTRFATQRLRKRALERHRVERAAEGETDARILVSCGQNLSSQDIRIVDPDTLVPNPDGHIGEILIQGPGVARGYWDKPENTAATFGARLDDGAEGPFLRSGDLGFFHEGELYITGRRKNLIILDGKNHYPHDIERTAEGAHTLILPGGVAAFSYADEEREKVVLVVELRHRPLDKRQEVLRAIRQAITVHHGFPVFEIRLARPGAIPRTTSGKKRHFLCKRNYLSGAINEIS